MYQIEENPKISIVILNWNGYEDTSECIKSLMRLTYSIYKIVVVDNGSSNDDYLLLEKNFPEIIVLRSETNLGFTGGNNLGIEYAMKMNPDYILLLNNDTVVEPNFIKPLLNIFEKKNKTGISAPQINYYNEPKRIWSKGGIISRIRGSGFAYSDQIEDRILIKNREVAFVSGCCMLIKSEVIKIVGLFDDKFFLYVEDVDLCKRVNAAGFKIYTSNSSKIFHKVSNSTNKNLAYIPLYYMTRNRLYFSKKNFPRTFFLALLYLLVSMSLKSIMWLIKGKKENIIIVKTAINDFFAGNMGKKDLSNIFNS